MRVASLVALAPLVLLGACGESSGTSAAADADTLFADGVPDGAADTVGDASAETDVEPTTPGGLETWTVEIGEDGCGWSARPLGAEEPLVAGPGCAAGAAPVAMATGGAPEAEFILGSFRIDLDPVHFAEPAAGTAPERVPGDGFVTLRWTLEGSATPAWVGLRFAETEAGHLHLSLQAPDGFPVRGGVLRWALADDESYFGLGAQVVGLDLRGRRYPLWTQEQGIGKPEGGGLFPLNNIPEASYAPMGVWHSTAGWSAVLDADGYTELDLSGDTAELATWSEAPALVIIAGDTPRERMAAVTEITGRIDEPAPWTFGPWHDAVGGPERLRHVSETLRAEGIPSSAIWSEDWAGGAEQSSGFRLSYEWDWDPTRYPDLPDDIAGLHAQGFAFLAYFNPFVIEGGAMWDEGLAGGFLIEAPEGGPYVFTDPGSRDASLVDLTNPDAVDWLKGYLTIAAEDLAIDGWMADFAEWLPSDAVVAEGDAWQVHNRYPVLWQQANREALEAVHGGGPSTGEGWTFFARSGWASTSLATAGAAPTLWGGDQETYWERDDGFPTVIPLGVHLGLAGVPIFGTDIAGYSSFTIPPTDKELYFRWTTQAAFTPLMRTHHGSSQCANWAFDRDAETLAHFRRWARVHTLLYPYFQALTAEAMAEGLPMMRHPWLVEPDRHDLWDDPVDAYFLGDDLWVAPVVEEGAEARTAPLPGDGWWPLFGGEAVGSGGSPLEVVAPATEIPVFVRPGTVLPLLAEAVDSFYGADDSEVTDLDDVAGRYRLALYPDADGALRETAVGGATVRGDGFDGSVDWTQATLDGEPLEPCGDTPVEQSCVLDSGEGVLLVGATKTLAVGDATLEIESEASQRYRVGLAGDAWGPLADPTPFDDPDPDIPPPCE